MSSILIVEDEDIIRTSLCKLLERHGYTVCEAVSVKAAHEAYNLQEFALIISDLRLPGEPGTNLISPAGPVPVLIMTSYASLRSAVDTMRRGAVDYISKPFNHDDMVAAVSRIIAESAQQQKQHKPVARNNLILGTSPAISKVLNIINRVAPTQAPVLIHGETGTAKNLVALAIHQAGKYADLKFHTINCSSVCSDELSLLLEESEPNSTIFLDKVCELPLELQPLVLNALRSKKNRLIASSVRDLKELYPEGAFREDLYFHLNVVYIQVPPLRERGKDVLDIAESFLKQLSGEEQEFTFSPEAVQALTSYDWPGNILELQNKLQQAAILCEPGKSIDDRALAMELTPSKPKANAENIGSQQSEDTDKGANTGLSLEDYFTSFVLENQENMSETELAKKLGISRKSLWERRQKLGISRKKKAQ